MIVGPELFGTLECIRAAFPDCSCVFCLSTFEVSWAWVDVKHLSTYHKFEMLVRSWMISDQFFFANFVLTPPKATELGRWWSMSKTIFRKTNRHDRSTGSVYSECHVKTTKMLV